MADEADETEAAPRQSVRAAQWESLDKVPVDSTNVKQAAYASDFRRFFVEFLNGMVYAYEGVPPEVWGAFLYTPSKGKFIYDSIRGAKGRRP